MAGKSPENVVILRHSEHSSFDLAHYGHANSLRQASEHGGVLVVGVHSDGHFIEILLNILKKNFRRHHNKQR